VQNSGGREVECGFKSAILARMKQTSKYKEQIAWEANISVLYCVDLLVFVDNSVTQVGGGGIGESDRDGLLT
jgi:hypothetical protein